jgi:hypothetical protein
MQNVNNTTVWRRRKSIQKKYLRYVVMQSWSDSHINNKRELYGSLMLYDVEKK